MSRWCLLVTISVVLFLKTAEIRGALQCWDDQDCPLAGVTCVNNICTCEAGSILSDDHTECLPVAKKFGDPCKEVQQCTMLTYTNACVDEKCDFQPGWVTVKGKLMKIKNFKESCTEDWECYDGLDPLSRVCQGKICVCSQDYYGRAGIDCRKSAKIGEPCLISLDCKDEGNMCIDRVCSIPSEEIPSPENDGDEEQQSSQMLQNVEEVTQECNVVAENHSRLNIRTACDSTTTCTANAHCSAIFKECFCDDGFFMQNDICVPELGNACTTKDDCHALRSNCINNKCACEPNFVANEINSKCVKAPHEPDFFCTSSHTCTVLGQNSECLTRDLYKKCSCSAGCLLNEDTFVCECGATTGSSVLYCSTNENCIVQLPNSYCTTMGFCTCEENYIAVDDKCVPSLGKPCKEDKDCGHISNSACKRDVCVCKPTYAEASPTQCIKGAESLHDSCDSNIQCSYLIENSYCNKNNKCTCEDGAVEQDGFCLPLAKSIGHPCSTAMMCQSLSNDVECRSGFCQCPFGTKQGLDKKSCVKVNSSQKASFFAGIVVIGVFLCFL